MASSFYGLERISTQTLMDILEVLRCNRSTARNDETMSALDFLTRHRATFSPSTRKGIPQVAGFLPFSAAWRTWQELLVARPGSD